SAPFTEGGAKWLSLGQLVGRDMGGVFVLRRHLKRELAARREAGRQPSQQRVVVVDPVVRRVRKDEVDALRPALGTLGERLDRSDLEPQAIRQRVASRGLEHLLGPIDANRFTRL